MATKRPIKEAISARREALREEHAEAVREKIQTTQLLHRLQAYALGDKKVKLTGSELKAIEMLLDKTLPNLASIKHEVEAKQVVFLIDTNSDGNPNNSVPTSG